MSKRLGDYTVVFGSEMLDKEYLPLEGKVAAVRDERLADEVSIQYREAHKTKVKRIRRTAPKTKSVLHTSSVSPNTT